MSFEPRRRIPGLDPEAERALVEVQTSIARECKRIEKSAQRPKRRVTELVEEGAVIAKPGEVVRVLPGDEDVTVVLPEPSPASDGEDIVISFEGDGTATGKVKIVPANGTCLVPGVQTLNAPGTYRFTSTGGGATAKPRSNVVPITPSSSGSGAGTWSGPPPVTVDDLPPIDNATLDEMPANSVKVNATGAVATPTDLSVAASRFVGRASTGALAALTGAQGGEIIRRSTSIIDTTSTGTIAAYNAGGNLTDATTQVLFNFAANVVLNGLTNIAGKTIEFYCQTGMAGSVTINHEANGGFSFRCPSAKAFTIRANEGFFATYWLSRWFVHGISRSDRLGRPVYDVVLDFGAANDGVTDDRAAINLAIAAANASPGIIYLGKSHVISGALTTITGNNVVLRGRGPFNGGTSIGVTAAVAPSEVIKITGQYCRLEDFYLFAVTPYTSGQAVLVEGGYRTEVFRIRLEDFANGIEVKTSTLTNIIDCELADLAGTYGIWVHGTSLGQSHATYIEHVIGNTTRSTTNTWFLHDSYAHTMRLLDCAALNGGYGLRVVDSLSSGADVPHFTRAVNLECDHNNLGGIVLEGGEQAEFEQLFVTSVIGGVGFDAKSTYNGDIRIDGAFFFATSREAIKLAAPHAILSGIIIGKASNGNTNTYDAIAVAANTTDFTITGCSASVSYHGASVVSRYALSIGSGCDDYVVTNNRFTDNVTGAILNTPGVSSTRIVRHNTPEIPFVVTESSGGTLNNYALNANADILKVTATATISGIAGGSVGRRIIVANGAAAGSGVTVTLLQFITSTAGNRFLLPGAADLVLGPGDAIEMQHGVVSTEWSGIDVALTLADGSVTLAKMANLAQSRIIGRAAGAGTGVPQALTPTQVVAIIIGETATWTGVHSFTGSSHTVAVSGVLAMEGNADVTLAAVTGGLALGAGHVLAAPAVDNGDVAINATGGVILTANATTPESGTTTGHIAMNAEVSFRVLTAGVERLEIEPDGAWQLAGSTGTAEALLTTTGASTPPAWGGPAMFDSRVRLDGVQNLSTGSQQNNLSVATANRLRCTASAAFDLTGMVAGGDGQAVLIANVGTANNVRIVDERDVTLGTASTAANRFNLQTNTSLTLFPRELALFVYDGTLARWMGGKLNSIA